MRVALYVRVSTDGQTVENQVKALTEHCNYKGWEIVATYQDAGISGMKGRALRPGFDALHNAIANREIEMVATWAVDRLGRSLVDLIGFLDLLHRNNCNLFIKTQDLDTSTPAGKLMFQMIGSFAEFERAMIVERVNAGIARIKTNGTKSGKPHGHPPKITVDDRIRINQLKDAGYSHRAIAAELNLSASTISGVINAA